MPSHRLLLGVLVGVSSLGCAKIEMVHVNSTERTLQTNTQAVETLAHVFAVSPDDAHPELTARTSCEVHPSDQVEITKHIEAKNRSAALDWTLGITGVVAAGLGAWALVDSANVYPNNASSRTYNPDGPGVDLGIGFTAIGIGALALAVTGVDIIRAQGSDEQVSSEWRMRPQVVSRCQGRPVGDVRVEARFESGPPQGRTVPVGATDADGRLVIDVTKLPVPAVDCGLESSPFGGRVTLMADGNSVGEVSLSQAYKAWIAQRRDTDLGLERAAEQELSNCTSSGSCDHIETYVRANTCYANASTKQRFASLLNQRAAEAQSRITAAEEQLQNAVRGLDAWARHGLLATWSTQMHSSTTCYNRVHYEVPCDSAAAFKSNTVNTMATEAIVRNGSDVTLVCGVSGGDDVLAALISGGTAPATWDSATIPSGQSHTFRTTASATGFILGMASGGGNKVFCLGQASAIARRVPASATLISGGNGQVGVGVVPNDPSNLYAFMLPDHRSFMWDGWRVKELTNK